MESNSVNITQADNTIVVIEPTGNTITIIEQNDSSEVTSQTQQFEGTVITQTSITLEIEDSPNTVNVIPERGVTEITVNQPVTETVKIATIGPQGPVGPIGPAGPSGSLVLSGSIDNDVIITGSVEILGSLTITGSVNGEFTGSLLGTASNAVSSSYAVSSSFSQTASYVNPLTQDVQITGSLDISGSFINNGLTYPLVDGESGRVIVTDGNGNLTLGDGERLVLEVRNDSTGEITVGCPVYSKGEIGGSNRILVDKADASDPTKMPAIGVLQQTLNTTNNKDGFAVVTGILNTNIPGFTGLTEGQIVYVKGGGNLTATKPTGSDLIQNVGIILKTNGTIIQGLKVSAIGRANDVPNITSGYTWVGNGDGVATPTPTSSFTTDPFPYTGSAIITGSLGVTGSITATSFTGSGSGLTDLKATETDLQQTLTANQTVGGVTSGETFAVGTDVEDLLRQILISYIQPSLSGLRMKLNGSNNDTTPREPGNSFNINTASFSATVDNPNGDFPFSSSFTSSGATIPDVEVYFGDNVLGSSNQLGIENTYTYNRTSPGNITFRVNAKYNEANTITTTRTVTFLYPYFYYKSVSAISSTDMVTAIQNGDATKVVASSTGTLSIPYNVSAEYLAVAYPSTSTTKTVYYVTDLDTGAITIVFNAVDTQNVNSPDSYWSGVSYKIHTSKNALTNSNPTIQLRNS